MFKMAKLKFNRWSDAFIEDDENRMNMVTLRRIDPFVTKIHLKASQVSNSFNELKIIPSRLCQ